MAGGYKNLHDFIPDDVDRIIIHLCHDYNRRKNMLARGAVHGQVKRFYTYLNTAIDEALSEECEAGIRSYMLDDIAENRGYRKTPIYCISQVTYYDRKRRVKVAIAKRLHYI